LTLDFSLLGCKLLNSCIRAQTLRRQNKGEAVDFPIPPSLEGAIALAAQGVEQAHYHHLAGVKMRQSGLSLATQSVINTVEQLDCKIFDGKGLVNDGGFGHSPLFTSPFPPLANPQHWLLP